MREGLFIIGRGVGQVMFQNNAVSGLLGAPDKPCGVGRADANPKLLLNDT